MAQSRLQAAGRGTGWFRRLTPRRARAYMLTDDIVAETAAGHALKRADLDERCSADRELASHWPATNTRILALSSQLPTPYRAACASIGPHGAEAHSNRANAPRRGRLWLGVLPSGRLLSLSSR